MPDPIPSDPIPENGPQVTSLPGWGEDARLITCEHCDWTYLDVQSAAGSLCPHCYVESLTPLQTDVTHLPAIHPPEAYLPIQLSEQQVQDSLGEFARRVPLAPSDLKTSTLSQRLRLVYFPRWLVDAGVEATWQAELGFYYDVVTHEERYDDSRRDWQTKKVTETKVRWEPRVGRLQRQYHNMAAPAMEEDPEILRALGSFSIEKAQSFEHSVLEKALVTLPNRSTEDAWPDAVPGFERKGMEECREAAGGDQIRLFKWRPVYADKQWSQLLLPVYSTYYLDDDQVQRPLFIHGQSGRATGVRRSSMKRARRFSLVLGILALAGLFLSVALSTAGYLLEEAALQSLGVLGLGFALFLGIGAFIPIAVAWGFNRSQRNRTMVFRRT